jgi:hypothetical protein
MDYNAELEARANLITSKIGDISRIEAVRAVPEEVFSQVDQIGKKALHEINEFKKEASRISPRIAANNQEIDTLNKASIYIAAIGIPVIIVGTIIISMIVGSQGLGYQSNTVPAIVVCGIILLILDIVIAYVKEQTAKKLRASNDRQLKKLQVYLKNLGAPESLHYQAIGLYAQLDSIWLDLLTPDELAMEQQTRNHNDEMELLEEQHEAQMRAAEEDRRQQEIAEATRLAAIANQERQHQEDMAKIEELQRRLDALEAS